MPFRNITSQYSLLCAMKTKKPELEGQSCFSNISVMQKLSYLVLWLFLLICRPLKMDVWGLDCGESGL
jgi:hypothetical protein